MTDPFQLPDSRPVGLRRPRATTVSWSRVDDVHPGEWGWDPFPSPFHRFDPLSGGFRARYAAESARAAVRERFPERRIAAADGEVWMVTLTGTVRVLDLTSETVLDRLGLDDRISTARLPVVRSPTTPDPFLDACGRLSDLVATWWDDVHAIRFRSRTTPSSTNVAFCRGAALEAEAVPLRDRTDLLTQLVIGDGFSVPSTYLA